MNEETQIPILTAAQIAAERLTLAKQRAVRAEQHLALQQAKEARHAEEKALRIAKDARLASERAAREARADEREARLAEKQSDGTPKPKFKYVSDETIDKRCLDRDLKILKIRKKLAESRVGFSGLREGISMDKTALARLTDEHIATAAEGAQQQRLIETRSALPGKIARSETFIPEYENEIKLFTEQIEQLERANDDDKNLRIGSL